MPHEFYDCLRLGCYIHTDIIPRNPLAIWPKKAGEERRSGLYVWSLYVEWKPELRGNTLAVVCEVHNRALLEIFEGEALQDRREQEVTEQWLTRVNSRPASG